MQSFLTGSRAYGTPRADSGIDLCVLLSYSDMRELLRAAKHEDAKSALPNATSIRFGDLNLLLTWDEKCFAEWKCATEDLYKAAPVTRDDAIEHFKKCEAKRIVKKSAAEELPTHKPPELIAPQIQKPCIYPWWVSVVGKGSWCVMAETKEQAGDIAAEWNKGVVSSIERLPYKARPVLNDTSDFAFCYKPTECAGRSSCPRNPCCTN